MSFAFLWVLNKIAANSYESSSVRILELIIIIKRSSLLTVIITKGGRLKVNNMFSPINGRTGLLEFHSQPRVSETIADKQATKRKKPKQMSVNGLSASVKLYFLNALDRISPRIRTTTSIPSRNAHVNLRFAGLR